MKSQIAQILNTEENQIVEIREWAFVYWVKVAGRRPTLVSKKKVEPIKEYFAIQCKAYDEKQGKDVWLYVRHMSKGWVPVSEKAEEACRFETAKYATWASNRLNSETRVIKAPSEAQGKLYVSQK